MKHFFLFYDSYNLLMAKRAWTEEEYASRAKYMSDAAFVVEVDEAEYNKVSVQSQNETLRDRIKDLQNER
jgi:hypothetical protein